MDRCSKAFCLLFVIGAPLWFGPIICNDLTHPELWADWMHDPRWYLPFLGAAVLATVWVFVHALLWQRRWERMTPEERAAEAVRVLTKGRRP